MINEWRKSDSPTARDEARGRPSSGTGAQYGAKRDMILKAAGPVLERHGFCRQLLIDAIAKEAGVGPGHGLLLLLGQGRYLPCGGCMTVLAEMISDLEGSSRERGKRPRRACGIRCGPSCVRSRSTTRSCISTCATATRASIIDEQLNSELIASGRRYEDLVEQVVRDGIKTGCLQDVVAAQGLRQVGYGLCSTGPPAGLCREACSDADDVADGMGRHHF